MNEINKLNLESKDLVAVRLQELEKIMPEVFEEGGIDFDKLRLLLGDEIDEGDERYAFTWPGKADAIRQSQTSTKATLRPVVAKSRGRDGKDGSFDSDNIYIEGDNLEALKLLQRAYHGKVKMIYIDPPYNTGHDFVYKDKFGDTIKNYKEQTGQANQSNPETSGRFHSDWCSMIYPRLKLARELLTDDGVVVISIDDNEIKNLRAVCDEIFGEQNFIASFIWQKRTSPDMRKIVSAAHEYLVAYAMDIDVRTCMRQLPYSDKDRERYKNPDNDPNGPWISTDCTAQAGHGTKAQFYDLVTPSGRVVKLGSGLCWRYTREKMSEEIAAGHIWFGADGNGVPRKKTYLKDMSGKNVWTWMPHSEVGHTQEATRELKELFNGLLPFDFPKPTRLLKRILEVTTYKDSLVMDLFSGSASLIDALFQLDSVDSNSRRFIAVQLPELADSTSTALKARCTTICDIGEERIRRAGNKIAEEVAEANKQLKLDEEPKQLPDIGFRVFELDESGIAEPQNGQLLVDRRKDGRSDLDIIFEVMLKWGYELTYPIEKAEYAGYGCYSVAAGDLVCCMEPGLTVDALEAIAAEQPRRVFIMDSVFGHDDSLKLDALAIFKHAEEKTQQKIELRTV